MSVDVSPDGSMLAFDLLGDIYTLPMSGGVARQVTEGPSWDRNPQFSPAGDRVLFASDRNGAGGLWEVGTRGQGLRLVYASAHRVEAPIWSPDGRAIFAREGLEQPRPIVIDAEDRNPVRQPWPAADSRARSRGSFSWDGRNIYYSSGGPCNSDTRSILRADLSGGSPQRITNPRPNEHDTNPELSRSTRLLAFIRHSNDHGVRLIVREMLTGAERAMWNLSETVARCPPGLNEIYPSFSFTPDERSIVLWAGGKIYRLDVGDGTLHQIPFLAHVRQELTPRVQASRLELAPSPNAGSFAIRDAKIITMTDLRPIIERGTLVVSRGRISAVGRANEVAIPSGITVLDGRGLTILPGIIDAHMHRMIRAEPRASEAAEDESILGWGVTSRFDPSTENLQEDAQRARRDADRSPARPRYFFSGPNLPLDVDLTFADARRIACDYRTHGASILKDGFLPSRRMRQLWVRAARACQIGITAHVETLEQALTNILDGYTANEHAKFPVEIYDDVRMLWRESGVVLTPTLGLWRSETGRSQVGWMYYDWLTARERPNELEALSGYAAGWPQFQRLQPEERSAAEIARIDLMRAARMVNDLARAGVSITVDGHNSPGILTHWGMWALADGGMPPMDVLRAATINGARKLGVDAYIGSIEVGKLADIVVLGSNPLDDIRNTLDVRFVAAQGSLLGVDARHRLSAFPVR